MRRPLAIIGRLILKTIARENQREMGTRGLLVAFEDHGMPSRVPLCVYVRVFSRYRTADLLTESIKGPFRVSAGKFG